MKKMIILILFLSGCSYDLGPCDTLGSYIDRSPEFHLTGITPLGIRIDKTKNEIDIEKIDKIVLSLYSCLEKEFSTLELPKSVRSNAWCNNIHKEYRPYQTCINCMKIKFPKFVIGQMGDQLLDIEAPEDACERKGLAVSKKYPCRWRSVMTENNIILSTPDMSVLPQTILEYITGCWLVWEDPRLAKCLDNATRSTIR